MRKRRAVRVGEGVRLACAGVAVLALAAAARAQTGTIGRGGFVLPEAREGEFERLILERATGLGLREAPGGLDALLGDLRRVQEEARDPAALTTVARCLLRPLSVDAAEMPIGVRARLAASGKYSDIAALITEALDLSGVEGPASWGEGVDPAELRDDLRLLVAHMRSNGAPSGPEAERQARAIERASGASGPVLAFLVRAGVVLEEWEALGRVHARTPVDLPEDLRGAVEGNVLHVERFPNGTIGVVGGEGPNRYDMTRITDVYDVGGEDVYAFARADEAAAGGNHHIIDLAGDDRYESGSDFAGPGVGLLGMSVVDDRAGDDVYSGSGIASVGAGVLGMGIVLDHAGDDRYENMGTGAGWSIGAGFYGCGLVIDRSGSDAYLGEVLCQGVGGPRGLGAIIDAEGDDSYQAEGPSFGSVYGTPGTFVAMSQGFGYGVRGYASGGIGAIYDLVGNDRYRAGEFAQGCGYFFALGVLHDGDGVDVYDGDRYGQGASAHQAVGVLIDDAGDDVYEGKTAANQGGAWDESAAMLIDRAGNDRYRAEGLSQGSAAMQALGLLIDLSGDDAYAGAGSSCQGQGGGNEYHHAERGVYSFSALVDLGGGADSASRAGDATGTVATGTREGEPASWTVYGMVVDE